MNIVISFCIIGCLIWMNANFNKRLSKIEKDLEAIKVVVYKDIKLKEGK